MSATESGDVAEYRRARTLIEEGDLAGAVDILSLLVQANTPLPQVYMDLASLATRQGDLETAEALLQLAVARSDAPGPANLHLAFVQATGQRTTEALATLSPLLRAQPNHAEALNLTRELLGIAGPLTPVAWARLLVDLRTQPAEHLAQIASLESRIAELTQKTSGLYAQLHQLEQENDLLRAELQQPRESGNADNAMESRWSHVAALEDNRWLNVLLQSVRVPSFEGFPLPLFPPPSLQEGMVGSSNEAALREGFRFYLAVCDICQRHGHVVGEQTRLLDFGTGYGRYARIFMGRIPPRNITGVDVDPALIKLCRETFPYATFKTVPPVPPSDLPTTGFDLIVGYSVFSHLSEAAANAWITEFTRLLAPGGIIAITIQGRSFLRFCEDVRQRGNPESAWHRNLARSFTDLADCQRRYDDGEFLYSATGGGGDDVREASFYGEALIPQAYVERHWTTELELLEFIDDRAYLPQALIVLRKR